MKTDFCHKFGFLGFFMLFFFGIFNMILQREITNLHESFGH